MEKQRCPKCSSILLTRNDDGDIECLCGYVMYQNKNIDLQIAELEKIREQRIPKGQSTIEIDPEIVSLKRVPTTSLCKATSEPTEENGEMAKEQTYFDQHRDEILADRLSLGHFVTLKKWEMSEGSEWTNFKRHCEEAGIEVANLTKMRSKVLKEQKKEKPLVEKHKPAEVDMEVPPPQSGTKKPHFDERREMILADYGQMPVVDLEQKWKMKRGYWYRLKCRWESEGITIPTAFCDRLVSARPQSREAPPKGDVKEETKPTQRSEEKLGSTCEECGIITHLVAECPVCGWHLKVAFPPFDSSWIAIVQAEWLKAYVELKKLEMEIKREG